MIKIKRITKLLLFSIFVILGSMYINKIQDEKLVMNELKEVYINKNHINNKLREKIEFNIKEEKITKADEYFILGYMSLKEDKDNNLAKKYFNLAIDNIDKNTSEFSKVYSYKFLSDIMIKENNIDKAIEYAEIAFLNIKPNNYNNNCKIVVDIFKQVSKHNEGRKVAIKHVNNIVEKKQILNAQSKTDLYRYLSALYILEQDYTQGVKVNLQVIKLNEKTKDDYYMGKSIVDLSIITRELGGYETSIEILNSIDTSNIDKELLKSDLEIYKLINLAQLQNTIGLYDEALKSANKITEYENDIPYTKREEIICMKNIVIAEIYINKNNIEMSKEYIKKVQDELDKEKSSYIHIEGYYYIALGKLNEKEGELNEAINNFEKAIEIIKEQTNIDNYRSCLGYLINIYNQLNDKENMLKYSDELIKIEQIKNDLISKKYYKYINYEEEYKKIEKDKNNIHKIMSSLFFLILGLVAALSKLVVYPYFENKKHRYNIKTHLTNDNYILNYQPIVNPKINKIIGFEALLRLKIDEEIIMPNIIIKEIEKYDMMGEVSIWILKKVLQDYPKINEMQNLSNDFYVSMNVSLKEIEDDKVYEELKKVLQESNIKKESICLEITESVEGKNFEKIKLNIRELMDFGFMIAIDDFGVDYSNLSFLEKFDFNIIKLDKYFIDNIDKSIIVQSLISAINYLSIKKDISIVMEGVEDIEQKHIIEKMISDKIYIQGYYYSRPVEIEKIKNINICKENTIIMRH